MNIREPWQAENWVRRHKLSRWLWESTRKIRERSPASETAAEKAPGMSRLHLPLQRLTVSEKTERRTCFDKRLDRWVGRNRYRIHLLAPIDLSLERSARQTRFGER